MSDIAPDLLTLAQPIDSLELLDGNPRIGDVDAVAASLRRFGQRKPIVARRSDRQIIAGNHTYKAACQLGWAEIAVVLVDDDDATAKAFALADNRTAELGGYDDANLAAMIAEVGEFDAALLADTGWSCEAVDRLLEEIAASDQAATADDDTVDDEVVDPPAPPVDPVTKRGDVWLLGPHRILCGDCREPDDVARLLDGAAVNVAFTSPPYADRRTYDESSGFRPIPPDEYVEWFAPVAANVAEHLAPDGSWFVNIKASTTPDSLDTELYVHDLVIAHVREWGWHFGTEFCWQRNGVPKQPSMRFKNQFEPVYHFALDRWKFRPDEVRHHSDNVPTAGGPGVGDTGWANVQGTGGSMFGGARRRNNGTSEFMSDVQGESHDVGEFIKPGLAYPGNRLPTFAGSHEATGHSAAFPVGLPEWFIKAYSDAGDNVFDPFMGSGSTLLAAHKQDRVAYGTELSPAYVDVICARFQRTTGIVPVLEATGEPHDFTDT